MSDIQKQCKLGSILTDPSLTELESKMLIAAIENGDDWPAQELSSAIASTRFSCGATTIKDHRRRVCACY